MNIGPVFNSNPRNGVTTFDIALISKHVLGIQEFTEPFTLLAADVDNSGEIDASDMLHIRQLILRQASSFPNNVNSWRFVPQYFLQQPSFLSSFNQNPFNVSYQGYCYSINSCSKSYMDKVTLDLTNEDAGRLWAWTFRPFKVGDVNWSFTEAMMTPEPVVENPYEDLSAMSNRSASTLTNRYQISTSRNITLRSSNERTIVLKTKTESHVSAFQLGFRFLPLKLSIKNIEKGDFNTSDDVFDFSREEKGNLRVLWYNRWGKTKRIDVGTILLKAKIKANENIDDILTTLNLDDRILQTEFYDAHGNPIAMDMEWEIAEGNNDNNSNDNNLIVNTFPNPFNNELTFEINTQTSNMAIITISSIITRQNMVIQRLLVPGLNTIRIDNTSAFPTGMMTYTIRCGNQIVNGTITKSR